MNSNSKIIYLSPQRSATKTFNTFCRKLNIKGLKWPEQNKAKFDLFAIREEYDKIINHSLFDEHQAFSDTPFWDLKLAEYIKAHCEEVFFVYLKRPFESWFKSMVTHSMGMTFDDIKVHAYYYRRTKDVKFLNSIGLKPEALNIMDNYTFYEDWYNKNNISTLKFLSQIPDKYSFIGQLNNENVWEEMFSKFNVDTSGINLKEKYHQTSPKNIKMVIKNYERLNNFFGDQSIKNRK